MEEYFLVQIPILLCHIFFGIPFYMNFMNYEYLIPYYIINIITYILVYCNIVVLRYKDVYVKGSSSLFLLAYTVIYAEYLYLLLHYYNDDEFTHLIYRNPIMIINGLTGFIGIGIISMVIVYFITVGIYVMICTLLDKD